MTSVTMLPRNRHSICFHVLSHDLGTAIYIFSTQTSCPAIRWLIAMYRHACCCQPGVSFWNISNNKTHVMCHDLRLGLPSFYTGLLRWFTLTSTCHFPRFTCHIYLFNLTNACCLFHYFHLPALSIIYADFCIPTETCHVDFLSLPTF